MSVFSSRRNFLRASVVLAGVGCHSGEARGSAAATSGADALTGTPPRALKPVPALRRGARVALVAPGAALAGRADLDRAIANVRQCGWVPLAGAHALAHDGYFAGSDADRLRDINTALRDPTVDAIWCLRGGYGLTRILADIDYDALSRRPRAVLGYSDVTALHAAIARRCGLISYHGPVAREALPAFAEQSLTRALDRAGDPAGAAPDGRTIASGMAHGRLAGGNLTLMASLVGTPFAPDLRGAIVVLEDTGVPVYAVDRMLTQLRMAGAFDGIAAIAFGQLTAAHGLPDAATDRQLDGVLRPLADALNVPCVAGLPVGHIAAQWTLPLGAPATLDAGAHSLTLGADA